MPSSPSIVITGVGIVSPLGIGWDSFVQTLAKGGSVARPAPAELEGLPIQHTATVDDFDPKAFVTPRKSIKLMCREIQFGVAAASLAVQHASLDLKTIDPFRIGVVLGSEMLYGSPAELGPVFNDVLVNEPFCTPTQFGKYIHGLFPLWMLKYLPNMPACHVGIAHNAQGANNTIVQGDASTLLAIIEASQVLQRGWADVIIAGGTGSTIQAAKEVNISEYLFSKHAESDKACRPFDKIRDGIVGAEGAGAFILETEQHARARGASILARLDGGGRTFEMNHPYHRGLENGASPNAIGRSISAAMKEADCERGELDHVNANGLSTQLADEFEAQAIAHLLGDIPVTAFKSYMGNMGAGSGAIELAGSLLAFQQGVVLPTLNFQTPDPACPINVIANQPKPVTGNAVLALNQSATGQAAAIVIRQP